MGSVGAGATHWNQSSGLKDHRFKAYSSVMTQCTLPFALAGFCAMISVASAEEMSTRFDTNTADGVTSNVVSFEFESCGGECQVATFQCNGKSVVFDLADVDAKYVAKAIVKEREQIVVTAGKFSVGYDFLEMKFQEMTGSWWISAHSLDEKAQKLAGAIAVAKTIEAQVGGHKIVLPVDANVKTWAATCK